MKNKKEWWLLRGLIWLLLLGSLFIVQRATGPLPLSSFHYIQLLMIPVAAFLTATPSVSAKWFGLGSIGLALYFCSGSWYQIRNTSVDFGWNQGITVFLLPIIIVLAVVVSSVLATIARQRLQTAIAKP